MYANIAHLMQEVYYMNKQKYIDLSNYEIYGGDKKALKVKLVNKKNNGLKLVRLKR